MKKLNKEKIAQAFAAALEEYIGEAYAELIDDLKSVGPSGKEYLRQSVRWTLVDESSGVNLLEDEDDKKDRLRAERAINLLDAIRTQFPGFTTGEDVNGADLVELVAEYVKEDK